MLITNLEISGSTDGGLNEGWDERLGNYCHVDFKIYWHGLVDVWLDKVVVDDQIGSELLKGIYEAKILEETTPEMFLLTGIYLKEGKFSISNYPAVNYVMNVMYNYLENSAIPISLKTP